MRISVQYTIIDKERNIVLSQIGTGYDVDINTTCGELKQRITDSVKMLTAYNIEKQEIKSGGNIIEDSEIIKNNFSYKCFYFVTTKSPSQAPKPSGLKK